MIIFFVLLGAMFMYAAYDYWTGYADNSISRACARITDHSQRNCNTHGWDAFSEMDEMQERTNNLYEDMGKVI